MNLLYNILYIVDKFYTFVTCCVLRIVVHKEGKMKKLNKIKINQSIKFN